MKYDSPVALGHPLPTQSYLIVENISNSYIEGYLAGFYSGALVVDNPYNYKDEEYDEETWERGRIQGRWDWRHGNPPKYQSGEN